MQKSHNKKLLLVVIAGFTFSSTPHCQAYRHDPMEDFATLAIAAGTTFLAGYGLYKLCDWAFSRTDEQIIADVETQMNRGQNDFNAGLTIIERGLSSIDSLQNNRLYPIEEPILYELALMHFNRHITNLNYSNSLRSLIDVLNSESRVITNRLDILSKKVAHDISLHRIYNHLNELSSKVTTFLTKLRFLHEYLLRHNAYFLLYETEASLLKRYDQELVVYTNYRYDTYACNQLIRGSVLKINQSQEYPFMKYAQKLQFDLNRLQENRVQAAYEYVNRLSAALELYDKLNAIYTIVITDPSYTHEIHAYQAAERERQRLEMERMKVAALQQQAWHLQQQNNELRKANELKKIELSQCNSCILCNDGLWLVDDYCSLCNRTPATTINVKFTI